MKSRQEIKLLAKESAAAQRTPAILVVFLYIIATGIGSLVGIIPFLGWLLSVASTFILFVYFVGLGKFFVKLFGRETVTVEEQIGEVQVNFFRKLGGYYWALLWTTLWSLLFVIPGIIKGIAYSMSTYILANHPNVTATNALKLSIRMTRGHKGKLFVMHLSFIGWFLLSSITFGILFIVYVGPYYYATMAGYFVELREQALANGTVEQGELDGEYFNG